MSARADAPRTPRPSWIAAAATLAAGAGLLAFIGDAYRMRDSLPAIGGAFAVILAAAAILLSPGILFAALPAALVFNTRRGFFPVSLFVFALACLAILDALRRRDARLHGPAQLHVAWLAVLGSGLIGLGLAKELRAWAGGMVWLLTAYLGLALVLRYATRRQWSWFALSIPAASIALCTQLYSTAFSRGFSVGKAFLLRSYFSDLGWGASNYVGAVVVVCLMGSLVVLLRARAWPPRAAALVAIPMLIGALALLVSRGTLVATGFGVALWIVLSRGRGRWRLLAVAALAAILLSRLPVTQVSVARFQSGTQSVSYVARVRLWQDALARFAAHPLLGVGLSQGKFQNDALQSTDPHNFALSVASESGIPGLLAWGFLAWTLLALPLREAGADPARRDWASALTAFTAAALFHACYEPTFPGVQYAFIFFWVYAVLLQGLRHAGPGDPLAPGDRAHPA